MWHALRAELAYARPWMLGALGIASAVCLFVSIVFVLGGGPDQPIAAGLRGFFFVLSGMVVGYIVAGYRGEERRTRLLMAGPLSPKQLAWLNPTLTLLLFAIGVGAAGVLVAVEALIMQGLHAETWHFLNGQVATLLAVVQLGPLAHAAILARRERRQTSSVVGWSCFLVLVFVLALSQLRLGTAISSATLVAVALIAYFVSVALYMGRTDFTK